VTAGWRKACVRIVSCLLLRRVGLWSAIMATLCGRYLRAAERWRSENISYASWRVTGSGKRRRQGLSAFVPFHDGSAARRTTTHVLPASLVANLDVCPHLFVFIPGAVSGTGGRVLAACYLQVNSGVTWTAGSVLPHLVPGVALWPLSLIIC